MCFWETAVIFFMRLHKIKVNRRWNVYRYSKRGATKPFVTDTPCFFQSRPCRAWEELFQNVSDFYVK